MKLTIILMLVFSLNLSAVGFSQISFDAKGKSIREVFGIMEKETNYRFFYNDALISIDKIVDIEVKNQTISQVLDKLFESTEFTFKVLENNLVVVTLQNAPMQLSVTGIITDASTREALPGVSIVVKGTTLGTNSDISGRFSLNVADPKATLIFSFIGYKTLEIPVSGRTNIDVQMATDLLSLNEVVVVGYGKQKRSDITGTVASLPKERLEMAPNLNIAQAIQGAIPGVMIQTTTAGAAPSEVIMIRGRNSILASNDPLIVVDGIPYGGQLSDLNPNDVQSIEILKDASAAAIYGSRGANGVILITTKEGTEGKTTISYDGKYSFQSFVKLPDVMDGQQFYDFKMKRLPSGMTQSEQDVYDSGNWVDWMKLGIRNGNSQQHNLSVSGGLQNTKYYIAGSLLDVQGLIVNDNFQRLTTRINVDTKVAKWLTIGTRTQLSSDDMSGVSPDMGDLFFRNPLATAYDENGNLTITPILDDPVRNNPLETTLFKNMDKSFQVVSNNFAMIDFPFIKGLSYRINTGVRLRFVDTGTYRGRDTKTGLDARGSASTARTNYNNTVIENILSFTREFGDHNIFATGVVSYEGNKSSSNTMSASGFPHDFLSWYSSAQAELVTPGYSMNETVLISQMLRLNYAYSSKYLLTLTVRRDGYSGFGTSNKWGVFPSVALGWNIKEEKFFPWENLFSELKLRFSYGLNGNQAVGAYESISRLGQENMVALSTSLPGYTPSKLGSDNLGWEASSTTNLGLDFGILENRISGAINVFRTNTTDLLLNRTISLVHGITSITQNIGETQNDGLEFSFMSRNIVTANFKWQTSGNISFVKNKIVSLYGDLDTEGKEIDDVNNSWFIGQPIRVNFGYVFDGVWQTDEAAKATEWGTLPGYIKIKDINGDGKLDADDRQIIGQQDPKFIWGLTNSLTYKNFTLDIFIHGVQGVTKNNALMSDNGVTAGVRHNTINKNWWTPDNPSNDFYMNHVDAFRMAGISANIYESASFMRIKDLSLSYDLPKNLLERIHLNRLKFYVTGRNLLTVTTWRGLDPELAEQEAIPMQKEYVIGLNLSF